MSKRLEVMNTGSIVCPYCRLTQPKLQLFVSYEAVNAGTWSCEHKNCGRNFAYKLRPVRIFSATKSIPKEFQEK